MQSVQLKRIAWSVALLTWMTWGCTSTQHSLRTQPQNERSRPPRKRPIPPPPVRSFQKAPTKHVLHPRTTRVQPRRLPTRVRPHALQAVVSREYSVAQVSRTFKIRSKGLLWPEQIKPLYTRARPLMKRCVQTFQRRFPRASKRFSFRLWIGAQGRVWKSALNGDIVQDPRTIRCLRTVLHRISFPPPGGFYVWKQDVVWDPKQRKKTPSKRSVR